MVLFVDLTGLASVVSHVLLLIMARLGKRGMKGEVEKRKERGYSKDESIG